MTRRSVLGIAAALILTGASSLSSQDAPPPSTSDELNAEYLDQTLARDIDTSGFYELVAWLESIGLSTRGDREALSQRLYDFYGLGAPTASDETQEPPLLVESATRALYFTLEATGEQYIQLSGGVSIVLRDEERNVVHRIDAEEIVFNQTQQTLSASGGVTYTLEREGTTEQFTGEALSVQLEDWDGSFVDGTTQRERTIEGQQIDFSFRGSYMTRSPDDVVVLEDGRVTSSPSDPPNYEIRASKIWVLAPGEWGLQDAVLHVGRVPVLYLPFFFRAGDDLFFNPSLGTRNRDGNYLQTTTYFVGSPEKSDSSFSFLQIAEDEQIDQKRAIDGLFLVPVSGESVATPSGDVVRLLADIYSKLGAYVAIDSSLARLGVLSGVSLYGGLAVSRNLYPYTFVEGLTYSPYHFAGGSPVMIWNTTDLGFVTLPLRFGIRLAGALQGAQASLTLGLEHYSDYRFRTDFDRRSEEIDWFGLLGQGQPAGTAPEVSSFLWRINATYSPQIQVLQPWVQRIAVQSLQASLQWRRKEITTLPVSITDADGSPQSSFFYPAEVKLPDLTTSVSGTLLNISSSGAPRDTAEPPGETDLVPPWDPEHSPIDAEEAAEEESLFVPPILSELPRPELQDRWNARIGYSISPSATVDHTTASSDWDQPSDVDYAVAYSSASARGTGSISYSGLLGSGIFSWNGSLGLSGQYRTMFNKAASLSAADWNGLQLQAYQFTSSSATNNLSLTVKPFLSSEMWAESSVIYSTNLLLYQLVFDALGAGDAPIYDFEGVGWDQKYFRTHQLQLVVAMDVVSQQRWRIVAELPPRLPRFTSTLDISFSAGAVSVSGGVNQLAGGTWRIEPIVSNQSLTLFDLLSVGNQLSFDVESATLSYDRISLAAGTMLAQLEFRNSEGYTFGVAGVGWQPDGVERVRAGTASVSGSYSFVPDPMWKNRVAMSGEISSSWTMNLLRFTESSFRLGLSYTLGIHKYLDLTFSSESVNSQSYVYIGPLATAVGRQRRSLIVDLLKSFNFFYRPHRVESGFNLQQITVRATHYLEDWDLGVSYSGRPEVVDITANQKGYEWRATLDINLQWHPIREIGTTIGIDADDVRFGGDS